MEKEKKEEALQASRHAQCGAACEAAGDLQRAEAEFGQAVRLHRELFERTGEKIWIQALREDYEQLADIHMQQGNMHGADHCYALSMDCRRRIQEE